MAILPAMHNISFIVTERSSIYVLVMNLTYIHKKNNEYAKRNYTKST